VLIIAPVIAFFQNGNAFFQATAGQFQTALFGIIGVFRGVAVADTVVEGVGGGDDDGLFSQLRQFIDARQFFRMAARQIRVAFDHLRAGDAAAFGFGLPEMTEADQCVIITPFLPTVKPWSLNAPECFLARIAAVGHPDAGFFHFIAEAVQHA
jgi:hypothetical protein